MFPSTTVKEAMNICWEVNVSSATHTLHLCLVLDFVLVWFPFSWLVPVHCQALKRFFKSQRVCYFWLSFFSPLSLLAHFVLLALPDGQCEFFATIITFTVTCWYWFSSFFFFCCESLFQNLHDFRINLHVRPVSLKYLSTNFGRHSDSNKILCWELSSNSSVDWEFPCKLSRETVWISIVG